MIQARKRFARIVGREPGVQVANKFWHGGADTEIRLADIIYADDTTLFEDTEHVQTWLDCLALEARAVGLEVSKKTEALAVGLTTSAPPLYLLDGSRVLYRDRVKLLGSLLPSCEVDVDHRISLAWHALRQYRALWRKPLGKIEKQDLFKVLVLPVLTYGAETWTLTADLARKLDGAVTSMLRSIFRVGYAAHVRNEDLYQGMPYITSTIKQRRLQLVGHLARTNQVDTSRGPPAGLRPAQPGRHLLTWAGPSDVRRRKARTFKEQLVEDMGGLGLSVIWKKMMDKAKWAQVIEDNEPPQWGSARVCNPTGGTLDSSP
eukprot:jgi/Mesvir1/9401/Mv25680-RA.1